MPQVPIIMPQLGESIAEARIVQFLVKPGDTIRGQYRVEQVSGDAVLLSDTTSGASSSLALR